ncbi:hypothetical protein [Streptomyces azureus]|uniref:Snsect kinin peptide n=1 Tax=Streptomyces azureus TaxID=146537 RepID=A0A0K8PYZ2_STRAJ|nr:hypothetical protein [Streptomyces azureus]GAP52679.1 snsect kinin peptide [Streptomyces azureus]
MGTWSKWEKVGDDAIDSAPSVASRVAERMTVVARNHANRIVCRSWTEGSGWDNGQDLGRYFAYDPAIISSKPKFYTVYGLGPGQHVYRKTYVDGSGWNKEWSKTNEGHVLWSGLAAASAPHSGPDATSDKEQRIDMFCLDASNGLEHATCPSGSSWQPFKSLTGNFQGTVAAASWGGGRIDVVARGAVTNTLWHCVFNGTAWSKWRDIGTGFLSGPALCTWGTDRLDVFAKDHDHQVKHRWWNGAVWSAWEALDTGFTDDNLAAVSRKPGNIELFCRGRDNHLYHRTYTADTKELDNGGVTNPN